MLNRRHRRPQTWRAPPLLWAMRHIRGLRPARNVGRYRRPHVTLPPDSALWAFGTAFSSGQAGVGASQG